MTVACIVIATLRRRELLDQQILPSLICQTFDEIVVIGDYHSGLGFRHLQFPPMTGTTIDAQFKRDMGTLVTSSEWLVYLSDDHKLAMDFALNLRRMPLATNTIGVPTRFTIRDAEVIGLNMGMPGYLGKDYCGGHAGVYHRTAIQQVPWALAPWHPNWDYYHSRILIERGYELMQLPACKIYDVEPDAEPWL